MSPRTSFALAISALLSASATAQTQTPATFGQVDHVTPLQTVTYDLATGTYTSDSGSGVVGRAPLTCYTNSTTSGSFGLVAPGEEWLDWGDKACSLTGFIDGFTIGYATTALDPGMGGPGASLDIAIFEGSAGGGVLGTEIGRFTLTGLPGSSDGVSAAGFTLPLTLSTPIILCDGDVGWSYVGVDGVSGPLLIGTTGVCFSSVDPSTGTADCFDVYTTPATGASYVGTFGFMTAGIASFYITFQEHDGSSSTSSVINGTGVNPALLSEVATATPNSTWTANIDLTGHPLALATVVAVSDSAISPILIAAGEVLIDPTLILFQDIALGTHTAMVPKAPGLLGDDLVVQGAIFDPSSGGLILLNAITFTLGL